MVEPFADRVTAGRLLARKVARVAVGAHPVVLALPRGGVEVGAPIARSLRAPLGAVITARFGVPGHDEITMGAVAPGGIVAVSRWIVRALDIPDWVIERGARRAARTLPIRARLYRSASPVPSLAGRTVVLVDDGLLTGASMLAAIAWARREHAARVIAAVPVADPRSWGEVGRAADAAVCLDTPRPFHCVAHWYEDFSQLSDARVRAVLVSRDAGRSARAAVRLPTRAVYIGSGESRIRGDLALPSGGAARGLVVFAHGSGSNRRSPRNRFIAAQLCRAGIGVLLVDLLTPSEAARDHRSRRLRFGIARLTRRLASAVRWAGRAAATRGLPLGLFGASTGAAAALTVAGGRSAPIVAVVCRSGRVDLAHGALERIACPVLLIVGGDDAEVRKINRAARGQLPAGSRLAVVPRAGHAFDEPGSLESAARLTCRWFASRLALGSAPARAAASARRTRKRARGTPTAGRR